MIKVQNNTATREPLPAFLIGLQPESLLDLSWTDSSLSVSDCGWWPEQNTDSLIDENTQRYGDEILTLDTENKIVLVTHEVVALTQDEIQPRVASAKSIKLSSLAALRYARETAGVTLNGAIIKTDLESQAKINGAWSAAQMNPAILIDWKADSGWIQIDAATITAIAMSVATHVQACFSNERVHAEAIALFATTEEIQAYDFTTGWPE